MIRQEATIPDEASPPTIWGLTPKQLHDRFWFARGVQVIRSGGGEDIDPQAELYLLTDVRSLAIFRLRELVELLSWVRPRVLWIRIRDHRETFYREHAVCDAAGRFVRFERDYGGLDSRLARVALTPDPTVARQWQDSPDPLTGWRHLRRSVDRNRRATRIVSGSMYSLADDREVAAFMNQLVGVWKQPHSSIGRNRRFNGEVWVDRTAQVNERAQFIGPAWVGAGRQVDARTTVVGPALLWDVPQRQTRADPISWGQIDPEETGLHRPRQYAFRTRHKRYTKRLFDVTLAAVGLVLLAPLFPVVMLAIWLEDGRPFFFAHRRETLGGQEFACLKFRSMKTDAEQIKGHLAHSNQADGPQFFLEDDPRLTRVGRFLRKYQIDELPQLVNVLAGQMSLVGPRPSPRQENQYCPAWREARLSVRPGITGLWQIQRTRQPGLDFQEWIRYDIEYVERANFFMDLWILWKTVLLLIRKPKDHESKS